MHTSIFKRSKEACSKQISLTWFNQVFPKPILTQSLFFPHDAAIHMAQNGVQGRQSGKCSFLIFP